MHLETKSFITGVAAGAIALLLSLFLRFYANAPFVPELAAQTLFSLVPGEIESQAVETFGSLAKYSVFVGAVLGNLILYGTLGALFFKYLFRQGYVVKALQFSLLSYLALLGPAILLLRTTEILSQPIPIQFLALYLLPPHLAYGFAVSLLQDKVANSSLTTWLKPSYPGRMFDHKRRLLIRAAAAGAVASIIFFYGLDLLLPNSQREPSEQSVADAVAPLLESEVTPNDRFYKVDVNIVSPKVDANTWNLAVKGLVKNPLALSLDEFRSFPSVEQYSTLECVSNEIGGDLISTALWKGVPLRKILEKALVAPEATYIVFRCHDGYDVGIPLERGLLDGTLLAYEMNGAPLPIDHGYPLRAIVPGLYGMMNAKWITQIELVNRVHEGFWQRRGWSNTAEYQTHSMIVTPGDSHIRSKFRNLTSQKPTVGGKLPIAGIAFAGDRGIAKVEVSTDGGKSWELASLKDPLSRYTWVLWTAEWKPPAKGQYKIIVRATDQTGRIQKAELANPFPEGATGHHVVDVRVEAPR